MKTIITLLLAFAVSSLMAQEVGKGHFQMNAGMDLYNTRNRNPITVANTIKTDLDFNYYVAEKFTVGLGFDYNTGLKRTNFSPGFRLYAGNTFFFRTKAYIPQTFDNVDVGLGIGNDFFLSDNWAIEGNVDYLIRAKAAYFRVGIALFL